MSYPQEIPHLAVAFVDQHVVSCLIQRFETEKVQTEMLSGDSEATTAILAKVIRGARALVHATSQPPPPSFDLTGRELDVLALILVCLNNTQIAGKLVISPFTFP